MAKRNKPQKTRTNPNNDIQLSAKLSRDVVAQEVRPAILLLEEIRDHQDKEKQRQLDLISCVSNVKNEVAALKSIIAGVDEILTSTRRHTTTNQVNTAKIRAAKAASETKPGLMPLIREYLEERSEDGWFRFGALVDFLVERYEPFGGYHKSLEELSNDARDRLSAPARGEHKGVFGMSPSHKLGIPMWRIDDGINNQGEPDYWYAFHDAFEDEDSWNAFADDTIFTD